MKISALLTCFGIVSLLIFSHFVSSDSSLPVVTKVIDGDTLDISGLGRVRLIGVDTPETVHPKKPVEYFGKEASNFLKTLATGKKVRVEFDQQKNDKYGRTLAYVFLEDGKMLNAEIIKNGYGHAYTRFPFKRMEEFRGFEKSARENNKGLWAGPQLDSTIVAVSDVRIPSSNECKRKTCSQISSCAEARALLTKCNFKSLDRDGDGTPCANLCR